MHSATPAEKANSANPLDGYFPYEILSFQGRLRLLDPQGGVAVFSRTQRIRFLEDGVGVFMDRVWGDGVLFANYYAREMHILEALRTNRGYVLLLSLPRRFNRGEVFEVETERRIVGGFLAEDGYWDSKMAGPTELLDLTVYGPSGRAFRRADVAAPPQSRMSASHHKNILQLQVRRPTPNLRYTLAWHW